MKKAFLSLAAGIVCAATIAVSASAHPSKGTSLLTSDRLDFAGPPASSANKSKALREFKKNFPGVQGEQWTETQDGWLLAHFNSEDERSIVFYDPHGNQEYIVSYYSEHHLPSDVRAIVKSTYYDCNITGVEEVHAQDKIAYLVFLQDDKTWKKVRVCDGEMDLMENFNKQ